MYWRAYGPANFLWFSDIALLVMVAALWLDSRLLTSMMALGSLFFDLLWCIDFLLRLVTDDGIGNLTSYMFDTTIPRHLRVLSLFHLVLPWLILWMLRRRGYDPRALLAQTLLAWLVLPLSYIASDRTLNVNWVYGPGADQDVVPDVVYLGLEMLLIPLLVYVPTHRILRYLLRKTPGQKRQ